jgi:hypothetical protein
VPLSDSKIKSFRRLYLLNLAGITRYLRIDHNTVIEISVYIPDNDAREHYLMNRELNNPNSKRSLVIN